MFCKNLSFVILDNNDDDVDDNIVPRTPTKRADKPNRGNEITLEIEKHIFIFGQKRKRDMFSTISSSLTHLQNYYISLFICPFLLPEYTL